MARHPKLADNSRLWAANEPRWLRVGGLTLCERRGRYARLLIE